MQSSLKSQCAKELLIVESELSSSTLFPNARELKDGIEEIGDCDEEEIGSNEFDQGRSEDLTLECCTPPDAYAIEVSGSWLISLPKTLCKSAFMSNRPYI